MEDAIEDRLSFRRFLGLGLIDSAIDETTFVAFRKRLMIQEGTMIDATILTAPKGRSKGNTRDKSAKVHDSKHIDQLIVKESKAVYANSAYLSKARKEELEERGVFCGITKKRVRGQAELSYAQPQRKRRTGLKRHPKGTL